MAARSAFWGMGASFLNELSPRLFFFELFRWRYAPIVVRLVPEHVEGARRHDLDHRNAAPCGARHIIVLRRRSGVLRQGGEDLRQVRP